MLGGAKCQARESKTTVAPFSKWETEAGKVYFPIRRLSWLCSVSCLTCHPGSCFYSGREINEPLRVQTGSYPSQYSRGNWD